MTRNDWYAFLIGLAILLTLLLLPVPAGATQCHGDGCEGVHLLFVPHVATGDSVIRPAIAQAALVCYRTPAGVMCYPAGKAPAGGSGITPVKRFKG